MSDPHGTPRDSLPGTRRVAQPDRRLAHDFVIVLNQTQDIVNIAGTVRAIANMGLERLRLVRPEIFDAHRIAGIAHGTEPLIEKIEFFDTLAAATADCGRVIGTTARRRTASYVWAHPREAAPELLAMLPALAGPIAIVFGPEDRGLSNEELDLCERLLVIPTNPDHPSLNLAQAVLLIGYELMLAASSARALPTPKRRAGRATPASLHALYEDTRTALRTIEFFKSRNERMVMRSLRAALRRADLNARDAGLLRAIVIEVRKYFERLTRDQPGD